MLYVYRAADQHTALLSVYDKTDLLDLAQGLQKAGVRLLGSGGTAKKIREAGIPIEYVYVLYIIISDSRRLPEMSLTSQKHLKCSGVESKPCTPPSTVVSNVVLHVKIP